MQKGSSSRWRTRAWAQAVIRGVESDAVKRQEAYPAEDVEMDLAGADISDDEFPQEPDVEEVRVLQGDTQRGKVGNHAHPQEPGTPQQGVALSRFAHWWSERDRDSSGE